MSENLTTDDFIQQLKHSKDPKERLYAAFKLGRDKYSDVIQPLIDASNDPEFEVRARVAEALGTREDAKAVLPTLIKLAKDENPVVRRTAADSLGHIASADAVPTLCEAMQDTDETVRSHAAEALGEIPTDESADILVNAFLNDDDYNVRYFAKQSLGKVGKVAVDAILDVVNQEDNTALLVEICEILANLGDNRAVPDLTKLENHSDEQVSEMATWALKYIQSDKF